MEVAVDRGVEVAAECGDAVDESGEDDAARVACCEFEAQAESSMESSARKASAR